MASYQATRRSHAYRVVNSPEQPEGSSQSASAIPLSHKHSGWHGTLTTGSTRIRPFTPHHWLNARLLLFTQPTSAQWSGRHFVAAGFVATVKFNLNSSFKHIFWARKIHGGDISSRVMTMETYCQVCVCFSNEGRFTKKWKVMVLQCQTSFQ